MKQQETTYVLCVSNAKRELSSYLWHWVPCTCVLWWNQTSCSGRCRHLVVELAGWSTQTMHCCEVCRRGSDGHQSTYASRTLFLLRVTPFRLSNCRVFCRTTSLLPSQSAKDEQPQTYNNQEKLRQTVLHAYGWEYSSTRVTTKTWTGLLVAIMRASNSISFLLILRNVKIIDMGNCCYSDNVIILNSV